MTTYVIEKEEMKNRLALLVYGYCSRQYGVPVKQQVPLDIMNLILKFVGVKDKQREENAVAAITNICTYLELDFKDFEEALGKRPSWWDWFVSDDFIEDCNKILKKYKIKLYYDDEGYLMKKDTSFFGKLFK